MSLEQRGAPGRGPRAPLRRLARADHAEARRMLAVAFDDDPYFRHLLPEADARQRFIAVLMGTHLRLARPAGRGVHLDGGLRGLAIWYPAGAYPRSEAVTMAVRAPAIARWLLRRPGDLGRVREVVALGEAMDRTHPEGPSFYLQVLAVDPAYQGRGIGSGILREVIAEADQARGRAVLETSKPANVRLYERFGFAITDETRIGEGPPVWTMVRPRQREALETQE